MLRLGILLLSTLSLYAHAGERVTERAYLTRGGDWLQFRLVQNEGPTGSRQVTVYFKETRDFRPDTEIPVLIGRDLSGNGSYDAWFFTNEEGEWVGAEYAAGLSDGWDAARFLISTQMKLGPRWLTGVFLHALVSRWTLTGSALDGLAAKIRDLQINLKELEVRSERIRREDPASPMLNEAYQIQGEGYARVAELASSVNAQHIALLAAADVALSVATAGALKGVGIVGRWAMPKVAQTAAGRVTGEFYSRYLSSSVRKAQAALAKVKLSGTSFVNAAGGSVVNQAIRWSALQVEQRVPALLIYLDSRGRLGSALGGLLKIVGSTASHGYEQRGYIGGAQLMQLLTEVVQRRESVVDSNMLITVGKITDDKDLLQNLSYMTLETFLLASVHGNPAMSFPKKFVISGVIAMVNSAVFNVYLKDHPDPARVVFDGGWEALVSNGQVALDGAILRRFAQSDAPGMKLVGFAIAMTDQLAGYSAYGWLTRNFERVKDRVGLGRVVSLQEAQETQAAKSLEDFGSPRLELIPIYSASP